MRLFITTCNPVVFTQVPAVAFEFSIYILLFIMNNNISYIFSYE